MDNENPIMTEEEIAARLLEIAKADEYPGLAYLKHARAEIYDMHLKALDEQIEIIESDPDVLRANMRSEFLTHVVAGGDPKISPSITFNRTKIFQYDKKHALQFVLDNDLPYTRITTNLDAKAFKKACKDGTINYDDGEEVNAPTVAIGKLGDLLIIAGLK